MVRCDALKRQLSSFGGRRSTNYYTGKGWKQDYERARRDRRNGGSVATTTTTTVGTIVEVPAPASVDSIEHGAFVIPHPAKVDKGGEDSYFTYERRSSSNEVYSITMGVADGVSGWAEDGVDPALYARELSKYGKDAAFLWGDPFEVLDYAHAKAESLGSSTFTVATVDCDSGGILLRYSNVGDSGVKVFRRGSVVAASSVQEHYFNCPKQLANPKKVSQCDTPDAAEGEEVKLRSGDVVVLATDGVFDNMFDKDIGRIVGKRGKSAGGMAEMIARKASDNSRDKNYVSPFAAEAFALSKKEESMAVPNGINGLLASLGIKKEENPYAGGKPDDITAVVAIVGKH